MDKEKKYEYEKPQVLDLGETLTIYGAVCTGTGSGANGGCTSGSFATGSSTSCASGGSAGTL